MTGLQAYQGKWRQIIKCFVTHIKGTRVEIEVIAVIVFVRLILGRERVDGFTGLWREIDIRYELVLKIVLMGLGCQQR